MNTRYHISTSTLAALLALMYPFSAVPQTPGKVEEPRVHELKLERHPDLPHGTVAIVEGSVGTRGVRFALDNLSILQPVAVTLQTPTRDADVRLVLSKYAFPEPARQASTRGQGWCTFQFRTEGDLQIALTSPEGEQPYRLAVWAGEEAVEDVPSVVVPMDEPEVRAGTSGGTTSSSAALWFIAAGLFAVAAVVALATLKRRSK